MLVSCEGFVCLALAKKAQGRAAKSHMFTFTLAALLAFEKPLAPQLKPIRFTDE